MIWRFLLGFVLFKSCFWNVNVSAIIFVSQNSILHFPELNIYFSHIEWVYVIVSLGKD